LVEKQVELVSIFAGARLVRRLGAEHRVGQLGVGRRIERQRLLHAQEQVAQRRGGGGDGERVAHRGPRLRLSRYFSRLRPGRGAGAGRGDGAGGITARTSTRPMCTCTVAPPSGVAMPAAALREDGADVAIAGAGSRDAATASSAARSSACARWIASGAVTSGPVAARADEPTGAGAPNALDDAVTMRSTSTSGPAPRAGGASNDGVAPDERGASEGAIGSSPSKRGA